MKISDRLSKILIKPLAFIIDKYFTPTFSTFINERWVYEMIESKNKEIELSMHWDCFRGSLFTYKNYYTQQYKRIHCNFPRGKCKINVSNIKEKSSSCTFEIQLTNFAIKFHGNRKIYNFDIFWN
jgi:hypothetical protein